MTDRVYICDDKSNIWYETTRNDKFLRNTMRNFISYLNENNIEYGFSGSNSRATF